MPLVLVLKCFYEPVSYYGDYYFDVFYYYYYYYYYYYGLVFGRHLFLDEICFLLEPLLCLS